jgi:uncharacterized protein
MNESGKESVVQSPCVRNCCLDDRDICLGCFRSLDEIISWSEADDWKKRIILQNASQRKRQLRT